MNDEQEHRKPAALHEIGADLSAVSAGELTARITELEQEIVRIRAEIDRKEAGRRAADNFFSPKV